jgi:hypothetical protein
MLSLSAGVNFQQKERQIFRFMRLIDQEMAERIAIQNNLSTAKLGLRFDKVVVRLLSNIRNAVMDDIPPGITVLITVTAPIKLPAKTESELCRQIKKALLDEVPNQNKSSVIYENKVCIRLINVYHKQSIRFLGFVHNPTTDPLHLLDMASRWLAKSN